MASVPIFKTNRLKRMHLFHFSKRRDYNEPICINFRLKQMVGFEKNQSACLNWIKWPDILAALEVKECLDIILEKGHLYLTELGDLKLNIKIILYLRSTNLNLAILQIKVAFKYVD